MNNMALGESTFVCGKTGSGKSFLTEIYTARMYFQNNITCIKLDTKNETAKKLKNNEPLWDCIPHKNISLCNTFKEVQFAKTKYIIYVPSFEEMFDDTLNDFFFLVYNRENVMIWIDELMEFTTASKYPLGLHSVMTRGRFKNVFIWACTQRPSCIPTIVMSNCEHFFIFKLPLPDDRKKMVKSTGCIEIEKPIPVYDFWYYKDGGKAIKSKLLIEGR